MEVKSGGPKYGMSVRLVAVALGLLPLIGLAAEPPPLIFEAPPRRL